MYVKKFLIFSLLHQTIQLILKTFPRIDDDSKLFHPSPFDKLENKLNVISCKHKKTAVRYWLNTKGEKSNRKLKSVQIKLKHIRRNMICIVGEDN